MSVNGVVVRILESGLRGMLGSRMTALRVTGTVTGAVHEFPVEYRRVGAHRIEVIPGRPESKKWWRNLRTEAPVQVLLDGRWVDASAVVVQRDDHPTVSIHLP